MKNKIPFISKLISSIMITILLIWFLIITSNNKLIFIPFIVCSISSIGKNIFIILENSNYIKIFNKIYYIGFLLFWFDFLIYATYLNVINKQYTLIVLSIIFWIIGIKLIKKLFAK